ncbi:MAG: FAD-dependent oxidoreductase [Candidatus Entotheonellia bacterium]
MADQFDLVILGSGSTAFAAALRAQELGKTAVMTEERAVGGTYVNRGCLPSNSAGGRRSRPRVLPARDR